MIAELLVGTQDQPHDSGTTEQLMPGPWKAAHPHFL